MGGQNHQPCSSYLENSTKLSRALSLSRIELELSNVCLEDLLLGELTGCCVDQGERITRFNQLKSHLHQSLVCLCEMESCFCDLEDQMNQLEFSDLRSLQEIDFDELGNSLSFAGVVEISSWRVIAGISTDGGFRQVLSFLQSEGVILQKQLQHLIESMDALTESVVSGELNLVLEENREHNLKVPFARLYCSWNKFQQYFLSSSMSSTEQWYRHAGFGSLLSDSLRSVSV